MTKPGRPALIVAFLILVSSCQCGDSNPGWSLYEDLGIGADAEPTPMIDVGAEVPQDVVRYPEDAWQAEEIAQDIPLSHALNERTSLAVDPNGTVFLGYHRCRTATCSEVDLTLGRRPRGGSWTFETVARQRGTFGIDVANREEVIAAYLDPQDNAFKVARRLRAGDFEIRTLGVRRTGPSDGLDITADAERMFVTFANERGDPVALFVNDDGAWRSLEALDIGDASAAYERGLASDNQGNLYLVHRNGSDPNPWGIARYSLRDGRWQERVYYEQMPRPRPSSFVVTRGRELCIAGDVGFRWLTVTCGDMTNLERKRWDLDEDVALGSGGYSSMLEGTDGSLYIAYPSQGNTELKLARRAPESDVWEIETVLPQNAYGVSTVIDSEDLLVISYYTCDAQSCSLEVLNRRQ